MTTNAQGQIVKRSDTIATVGDLLQKYEQQIKMALPREISVKRLIRVALTTMRKTPKLAECTPASLCGAVIQAAQLGLDVDSNLGHAYLVPYGNECTLIVGYRGMLDLVRRSGESSSVEARAVYEGDAFEVDFGLDPKLRHKPCGETDPLKLTHVYAIVRLRNGAVPLFDVMTRAEIEKIRNRSRAKNSGPWITDYVEMAKKTVLRRLCKIAPMNVEAQKAIALDEAADANLSQQLDVEWKAVEEQPVDVKATPIDDDPRPDEDKAMLSGKGE